MTNTIVTRHSWPLLLLESALVASDPLPESHSLYLSPDNPVAFLASSNSDPVVNEDVQVDFYNPLAFTVLLPKLSNALALISVSSEPMARLNTILDSLYIWGQICFLLLQHRTGLVYQDSELWVTCCFGSENGCDSYLPYGSPG